MTPEPVADPAAGGEVAGLEEQRDVLLASLRDLEKERAAGEIGEDDYVTLKDDYTARAAAVLRAIEAGKSAGAAATATGPKPAGARPGPPRPARRAPVRGAAPPARRHRTVAITLGVAFAIVAVAGISVVLLAGGREPGQPVTGSVPTDNARADANDDDSGDPIDNSTARITEALSLESEGRAVDALKIYDEVLAGNPDNVEALAYRGWLLQRAGLPDKALESLDRAVALAPTFPDAHFFRGMVLYKDRDDPAGAVLEFKAFLANNPPPGFVAPVQKILEEAEQAAAAKAAGAPPPATPTPDQPPPG